MADSIDCNKDEQPTYPCQNIANQPYFYQSHCPICLRPYQQVYWPYTPYWISPLYWSSLSTSYSSCPGNSQ